MKIKILGLCCLGAVGSSALAALPEVFRTEYNASTNHSDDGIAVAADGRGGCYVAGSAYSPGTSTYDAHLVSIGPTGVRRWKHEDRISGESEVPSRVAIDGQGNILMLSFARSSTAATLRTAKFDKNGNRLFSTDVSRGTSVVNLEQAALAVDAHGNAYIGNARNMGLFVAKISSTGSVIWERQLTTSDDWHEVTGLAVDPTGGVVAVGVAGMINGGYKAIKLDDFGNTLWTHDNPGPFGNTLGPAFIRRLASGDYVVLCSPESTFGVPQYQVYRLTSNGALVWDRVYKPQPQFDCEATGLAVDRNDNVIVTGFRLGGGADTVTVKYDSGGNRLWEANFTSSSASAADVVVDRAGMITITGFLNSGSSTGLLVRYDPSGTQVWSKTKSKDNYVQLAVDAKGSVFVVGSTFVANNDFVIARYAWLSQLP